MRMETLEITVSRYYETPQRSIAITDAETNNVLSSTMQVLL